MQDGETGAPYKRVNAFLQDESQYVKEDVYTPPVQFSQFSEQELKDSYLLTNTVPSLYPIEQNQDEEGNRGYRYSIFPVLNPLLYESSKIFSIDHLAPDLEGKL